ncbi:MAG: hypothetical protein COT18_01545 [Elusimicrobia bacterium CG08_land_8_20_14_0_20_59_10]|nr:MAG: hypothetical protein COT18_01545 [Elusimicrobia bacterium CG08_land_8_20_14_0_20_59_10]
MEDHQAGRKEKAPRGKTILNPAKLARLIYPGYRFGKTSPEYALRLVELGVGGFCFYGGGAEEVREISRTLRAASATPLLIASDYENGAGQWVKGATELPSNMAIGASGSEDLARRKGEITALEAKALGVDWILAPVVDLACRPDNPIVNIRAFGAGRDLTSRLAGAYLSGVSAQGALSCLKHFPGHGDTAVDSHLALPELGRDLQELEQDDLKPFSALARRADSVMAGHLRVPSLDGSAPASLSGEIIGGLLRCKLGYGGLVLTDALNMKAVCGEGGAGVKALLAGADLLLCPEDPFVLFDELMRAVNEGEVKAAAVELALARQDLLVRKLSPYRVAPPAFDCVNCPEHRAFNAEAAPQCLAWATGDWDFRLQPGETVGYFEPLTPVSAWKGAAFVAELARLGLRVAPYVPGREMRLVSGVFSGPRAGQGGINLSREEKADLEKALVGAESSVITAFGSPFIFSGLANRPSAGLCAFCALEDFQRAAARALTGAVLAGGKLPVNVEVGK